MRFITLGLIVLLGLLQYRLWFGNGSVPKVRELERTRYSLLEENEKLLERNLALSAEVIDLKEGKDAIEERARSEMGMIKADEVFYQIVTTGDEDSPEQQPLN